MFYLLIEHDEHHGKTTICSLGDLRISDDEVLLAAEKFSPPSPNVYRKVIEIAEDGTIIDLEMLKRYAVGEKLLVR